MAIFAPDFRWVGGRRTAARASASAWCAYLLREGEHHEKGGLRESHVLLPDGAPERWEDPHVLWAEVDAVEAAKKGTAGREFMLPLPRELTPAQNMELGDAWLREEFVEAGFPVHAVYHVTERGDWHLHGTAPLRPWDGADGFDEHKYVTVYPVRKDGEERLVRGGYEWEEAKADGWEKVFRFKDGEKRTKTECVAAGLSWKNDRVRTSKNKFKPVEINVELIDWASDKQLVAWRKSWADAVNRSLERYAPSAQRVDHRSLADQGIEQIPGVHLGHASHYAEKRERERCARTGENYEPITVLGAKNAEIDRHNAMLREPELQRAGCEKIREEILEHGYELRGRRFIEAEEVREHSRPFLARVWEKVEEIARAVGRIAVRGKHAKQRDEEPQRAEPQREERGQQPQSHDRGAEMERSPVLAREVPGGSTSMDTTYNYPRMRALSRVRTACEKALRGYLCRTVRQYANSLRLRGVHLMQSRDGEFSYESKGETFTAREVGNAYSRAAVEAALHDKSGSARYAADSNQKQAEEYQALKHAKSRGETAASKEPEQEKSVLSQVMARAEKTHGRRMTPEETRRDMREYQAKERAKQRNRDKGEHER